MVYRFVALVTGYAVRRNGKVVVKDNISPVFRSMTGGTLSRKMLFRENLGMANPTLVGCPGVFAIDVTIFTRQKAVLAGQLEEFMLGACTTFRELHNLRVNRCCPLCRRRGSWD